MAGDILADARTGKNGRHAASWTKPRRVIAKVEWQSGRTYSARRLHRDQHEEGKGAIHWTRLSCRTFAANAVRLRLHALAHNLGNFLRTLATPEPIKDGSLTSLKEKLIKIGDGRTTSKCRGKTDRSHSGTLLQGRTARYPPPTLAPLPASPKNRYHALNFRFHPANPD
jgi:hypothetical protein